jgi:hypothetical protein
MRIDRRLMRELWRTRPPYIVEIITIQTLVFVIIILACMS